MLRQDDQTLFLVDEQGQLLDLKKCEILNLSKVKKLYLQNTKLNQLKDEHKKLFVTLAQRIKVLHLSNNRLKSVPKEIEALSNLKKLDLTHNQLKKFHLSICRLSNLEELNMHDNQLIEIPEEVRDLRKLRCLDISLNNLKHLPPDIGYCQNLTSLVAHDNPLFYPPAIVVQQGSDAIIAFLKFDLERLKKIREAEANMKTIIPPGKGGPGSPTTMRKRSHSISITSAIGFRRRDGRRAMSITIPTSEKSEKESDTPKEGSRPRTPSTPDQISHLRGLLGDETGFNMFKDFLESEFALENLSFWKEVEEFRVAPEEELLSRARSIYNTYVADDSPYEINVAGSAKESVRVFFEDIDSESRDEDDEEGGNDSKKIQVDRKLFDSLQDMVLHLMESNSYRRFVQTDPYKQLQKAAEENVVSEAAVSELTLDNGPGQ